MSLPDRAASRLRAPRQWLSLAGPSGRAGAPRALAGDILRTLASTIVLLSLLLFAVPAEGAQPVTFASTPWPSAATFIHTSDKFEEPPQFVEPFGWNCQVTRPWSLDIQEPGQDVTFSTEVACNPPPPPPTIQNVECRNPSVHAYGEGFGTVTGTVSCKTIAASCSASVVVTGSCANTAPGVSAGPLVCKGSATRGVIRWSVTCANDP